MLSRLNVCSIERLVRFGVVVPVLAALAGCETKGLAYAPVSGKVTLDGSALSDVVVQFYYISELPSEDAASRVPVASAKSDAQGQFEMHTLTSDRRAVNGAAVGLHRVSITSRIVQRDEIAGDRVLREELIPARFNENSKLIFEVPAGGTDECHFDLTSR